MKIRVCNFPYWTFFWMFVFPLHLIICIIPIICFVEMLIGIVTYETVKITILGGAIYFLLSVVVFVLSYCVWRKNNPQIMVLSKKSCKIVNKKDTVALFEINNLFVELDYPDFYDFITAGLVSIIHARTKIYITTNDGERLLYEIGISKITAKRIASFQHKYQKL